MERFLIHYGIHFLLPLFVALIFFEDQWLKAYLILLAGLFIDLDHLLANPVFDPNRCSINFHPLHSYYAMPLYGILVYFKKTRLLGIGLIIHIIADLSDCTLI